MDTRKRKIDFDREAILEREERELARLARVVAEGRKLKRQAARDGAKSVQVKPWPSGNGPSRLA